MKRKRLDFIFVLCVLCFLNLKAVAQLSSNPDKFLGNITTRYNVDYGNEKFYTLWNQITCENESKWGSIEGSRRGSFNWEAPMPPIIMPNSMVSRSNFIPLFGVRNILVG